MRPTVELAKRLLVGVDDAADLAALLGEGECEGLTLPGTSSRFDGHSDWVVYLPSCGRAVAVANGNPVWYDARSLADAVRQWRAQEPLVN